MSWIQLGYGQQTQGLGNNWGAGVATIQFSASLVGTSVVNAVSSKLGLISAGAIGTSLITARGGAIRRTSAFAVGNSVAFGSPAQGQIRRFSASLLGISIVNLSSNARRRSSGVAIGTSLVTAPQISLRKSGSASLLGQAITEARHRATLRPSASGIGFGSVGQAAPRGLVRQASAFAIGIAVMRGAFDEPVPFIFPDKEVKERFLGDAQKVNTVAQAPGPNVVRAIRPDKPPKVSPSDRFPFPGPC